LTSSWPPASIGSVGGSDPTPGTPSGNGFDGDADAGGSTTTATTATTARAATRRPTGVTTPTGVRVVVARPSLASPVRRSTGARPASFVTPNRYYRLR
jgi:hypothetical protein